MPDYQIDIAVVPDGARFPAELAEIVSKAEARAHPAEVELTPKLGPGFERDAKARVKESLARIDAQVTMSPTLSRAFRSDVQRMVKEATKASAIEVPIQAKLGPKFRSEMQRTIKDATASTAGVEVPVQAKLGPGFRSKFQAMIREELDSHPVTAMVSPTLDRRGYATFIEDLHGHLVEAGARGVTDVPVHPKLAKGASAELDATMRTTARGASAAATITPHVNPHEAEAGLARITEAGAVAKEGLSVGWETVGQIAAVAGFVVGERMVSEMIAQARDAEKQQRITANALRVTGDASNMSAEGVEHLGRSISDLTGKNLDEVVSGENMLLTFKGIRNEVGAGNDIYTRATKAAVDLSVQFGSVNSGAKMMGKALNDPVKGLTSLGRAGVQFTEQQKDQIKALVASGKTLQAQKIILGEVETQVGGAAKAAADPIDRLNVAWENLLRQSGEKVLPWINDIAGGLATKLPGAVAVGQRVLGTMFDKGEAWARSLWHDVEPAVDAVGTSLHSLWIIGGQLFHQLEPVGALLLGLGGSAIIIGITILAKGLEAVTGWLSKNKTAVHLLADALITLATIKAVSAVSSMFETLALRAMYAKDAIAASSTVQFGAGILGQVKLIGAGLGTMVSGGVGGFGLLRQGAAGLASALISPVTILAGIVIEVQAIQAGIARAHAQAKAVIDSVPKPDPRDITAVTAYAQSIGMLDDAAQQNAKASGGWKNALKSTAEQLTPLQNSVLDAVTSVKDLDSAWANADSSAKHLQDTYRDVYGQMAGHPLSNILDGEGGKRWQGLLQVETWIKAFNLDPVKMNADELTFAIRADLAKLAFDAGARGTEVKDAVKLSPDELKAQVDAWQKLSTSIGNTWRGQLDIVSALGSQQGLTGKGIAEWYSLQTAQATAFSKNIATAIKDGYDPQLVSRLLQAGPAQAAPLLQAIVSGHAHGLEKIVNMGETALSRLSTLAVEMGRLQLRAQESQTDSMTNNLGEAMRIAQIKMSLGTKATWQSVAKELGVGAGEVAMVAAQFGIDLAGAIDPVRKAVGAPPIPISPAAKDLQKRAAGHWNMAGGGLVPGPRVRADIVPAMLMPDEIVLQRDAVDMFGKRELLDLNEGRTPPGWVVPRRRYAAGGLVTAPMPGEVTPDRVAAAKAYASQQVGKPYVWGAVGPDSFDCSGLWSAIVNVLRGQAPNQRLFTSASLATGYAGLGILPGLGQVSIGDKPGSHVAGTIAGTNFEATPPAVLGGSQARGADSSFFPNKFHIGSGYFLPGGAAAIKWPNVPVPHAGYLGSTGWADEATALAAAKVWAAAHVFDSNNAVTSGGDFGGVNPASLGPSKALAPGMLGRILGTIAWMESRDDPTAHNPSGSASGMFQITDGTWGGYGGFAHAYLAPLAVQIAKASAMVQTYLALSGGDVQAVPEFWYLGHRPTAAEMDQVPAGGNRLTPRQYDQAWLAELAQVKGYKDGGLVTADGLYRMAENNKPELVLPLTQPARVRQLVDEHGLGDLLSRGSREGGITIEEGGALVQVVAPGPNDPELYGMALAHRLVPMLAQTLAR